MHLGRLGLYSDAQKSAIHSVIAQGGPTFAALPANTLLDIAATNALRMYDVSSVGGALGAGLALIARQLGGNPRPYLWGGRYGFFGNLTDFFDVTGGSTQEDPNQSVGSGGAVQQDGANAYAQRYGNPPSIPGWSWTGQWDGQGAILFKYQPPAAVVNDYKNFFIRLKDRGLTQVLSTRWGAGRPDTHAMGYKDPLLVTFDPEYGLVTPASNAIFPELPDNSLKDIVTFIMLSVAMYGAVTAASGAISGGEAMASVSTESTAAQATQAASQTALTEAQVAGEEALREYGLAESLGASITQGEAAGWLSALQSAGLSVPAEISSIASGVTTSSVSPSNIPTSSVYEAPPPPASATEISTSADEALREIEFARLGGATVTPGEASGWVSALNNAGLSVPSDLAAIASGASNATSLPRFGSETMQKFPNVPSSAQSKLPPSTGAAASPLMKLVTTGAGLLATQKAGSQKATTPGTRIGVDVSRTQAQSNKWLWVLVAGAGIYAATRKRKG